MKQVATARGLGFRGAYLGGKLEPSDCEGILFRTTEFGPDDWKASAGDVRVDCPDEFYYVAGDEETGLSSSKANRALVASRRAAARRRARLRVPVAYCASRLTHSTVFDPRAPLFDLAPSSMPELSVVRARPRVCSTLPSTPPRSRCSTARTAETVHCRRLPIVAPSPNVQRTNATAPAAARATASARSPKRSASGTGPTKG